MPASAEGPASFEPGISHPFRSRAGRQGTTQGRRTSSPLQQVTTRRVSSLTVKEGFGWFPEVDLLAYIFFLNARLTYNNDNTCNTQKSSFSFPLERVGKKISESTLLLGLTAHRVLHEQKSFLFLVSLGISGGFVAAPAPGVL